MIEVKNRSEESWGPLAKCGTREFFNLTSKYGASTRVKDHIKKAKKLKTYKVTFKKEFHSDQFEIQAESDWDIGTAARKYFKENEDKIGFVLRARTPWADSYAGYDSISYVKVK